MSLVRNNKLRLVELSASQQAAVFFLPTNVGACAACGWRANFTVTVFAPNMLPAHGMSIMWGPLPVSTTVAYETYPRGFPGVQALTCGWQTLEFQAFHPGFVINTAGSYPPDLTSTMQTQTGTVTTGVFSIHYSPSTGVSFATTNLLNNANITNFALPLFETDAAARSRYVFAFGSNAVGLPYSHELSIDDIIIASEPEADCEATLDAASYPCRVTTTTTVTTQTSTWPPSQSQTSTTQTTTPNNSTTQTTTPNNSTAQTTTPNNSTTQTTTVIANTTAPVLCLDFVTCAECTSSGWCVWCSAGTSPICIGNSACPMRFNQTVRNSTQCPVTVTSSTTIVVATTINDGKAVTVIAAVGGGVGGLLILAVVGVCVCLSCRRKSSNSPTHLSGM